MFIAELCIGILVHVADARLDALRQRHARLASIEDGDPVPCGDRSLHARKRNLAGAADIENAERHGVLRRLERMNGMEVRSRNRGRLQKHDWGWLGSRGALNAW